MELHNELYNIQRIRETAKKRKLEFSINLTERGPGYYPSLEDFTEFLIESFHFERLEARRHAQLVLQSLEKYRDMEILCIFIKNVGTQDNPVFDVGVKTP
jgi:hypothetical protein